MSGVRRNILAELAAKGITGEEAQKALSPAGQLEETGQSELTPARKATNDEERHIGKNAYDATPGK